MECHPCTTCHSIIQAVQSLRAIQGPYSHADRRLLCLFFSFRDLEMMVNLIGATLFQIYTWIVSTAETSVFASQLVKLEVIEWFLCCCTCCTCCTCPNLVVVPIVGGSCGYDFYMETPWNTSSFIHSPSSTAGCLHCLARSQSLDDFWVGSDRLLKLDLAGTHGNDHPFEKKSWLKLWISWRTEQTRLDRLDFKDKNQNRAMTFRGGYGFQHSSQTAEMSAPPSR